MSSFGDFIALSDVCDVPTAKIISREVGHPGVCLISVVYMLSLCVCVCVCVCGVECVVYVCVYDWCICTVSVWCM